MTTFFLIRHASCCERFKTLKRNAIYRSPLERALQTAEALARNMNLEVRQSAAANEINFGEWTGKPFDELSGDERWQRFNSHRSMTTIPGGESFLEVQNRIVKEIESLALQQRDARVAIV